MMELSLNSKSIKKRHKKKKIRVSDNVSLPILKPNSVDGVCNWTRLQKIMGPVREENLKKAETNIKTNQYSKDYIPPFSQKANNRKKSTQNSQEDVEMKVKNVNVNTADKGLSKSTIDSDQLKATSKKDQNQPHKFNFNGSVNNSPKKNSDLEMKSKYAEKRLTKAVAMDCEMVGTGPKGEASIIARVSIVNAYGVCLYDEFVKPKERVTDFRTKISGVRPSDLKKGKDLFQVQKDVLSIIEGRILVGHSIKHDLDVLFLSHPRHLIRDTSFYKPFREMCGGKTPSLKKLTSQILGCEIQSGEHSSIEDAQAAMLLYLREKREWEKLVKDQRRRKPRIFENQTKNF